MTQHDHSSLPADRHESRSALIKTLYLVFLFMGVEFLFGWLAHSLALITDALHLFTDAGAILLSLFAFWIAKKPANSKMSFGYHRIELIAALVSGGASWVLSAFLIYEGIHRLLHPHPVNGPLVLIVAAFGLIANLVMLRFLHPTQSKNLNVKGAYIHILGDLLASSGVLISGLLITLTHYYPLDPIVTFLISFLVIKSAWKLIKETSYLLMEGTPQGFDPQQIEEDLLKIPSVEGVHDLHIWAITPRQVNLSVHLISKNGEKALREAEELLHINYQIHHTTIQVEFDPDHSCSQCPFQK